MEGPEDTLTSPLEDLSSRRCHHSKSSSSTFLEASPKTTMMATLVLGGAPFQAEMGPADALCAGDLLAEGAVAGPLVAPMSLLEVDPAGQTLGLKQMSSNTHHSTKALGLPRRASLAAHQTSRQSSACVGHLTCGRTPTVVAVVAEEHQEAGVGFLLLASAFLLLASGAPMTGDQTGMARPRRSGGGGDRQKMTALCHSGDVPMGSHHMTQSLSWAASATHHPLNQSVQIVQNVPQSPSWIANLSQSPPLRLPLCQNLNL